MINKNVFMYFETKPIKIYNSRRKRIHIPTSTGGGERGERGKLGILSEANKTNIISTGLPETLCRGQV